MMDYCIAYEVDESHEMEKVVFLHWWIEMDST